MLPIGDDDQPGGGLPIVNLAIIAINVLVFILLQLPSDAFTMGFSAIPREITTGTDLVGPMPVTLPDGTTDTLLQAPGPSPIWLTLFTSMFMHGGWTHIGGNMLFLFIFGDNVERLFGSLKYLAFYLICGVAADFAQIYSSPDSVIAWLTYSRTCCSYSVPSARRSTSGCSGAITKNVAPNSVSGRVVKTG